MYYMEVVIVDFETSVMANESGEIVYEGGLICWPWQLLENIMEWYKPLAVDDLMACILLVLHFLFPGRFDMFNAGNVGIGNEQSQETRQVLQMWKDIESSKIWGPFTKFAHDLEYEKWGKSFVAFENNLNDNILKQ